jgi:anti-anti-sigma factor
MNGVNFIASIGIRHLALAAKVVARGSGRLVLLDPNPAVRHILVGAGLDAHVPIVRSEDEAWAALGRA